MRPRPPMYADVPIPTPRSDVGYSSPAKGYMTRNGEDIANFENRKRTRVATTASANESCR